MAKKKQSKQAAIKRIALMTGLASLSVRLSEPDAGPKDRLTLMRSIALPFFPRRGDQIDIGGTLHMVTKSYWALNEGRAGMLSVYFKEIRVRGRALDKLVKKLQKLEWMIVREDA